MSIERCETHNQRYDTDFIEQCPMCEDAEIMGIMEETDPYEGDYDSCRPFYRALQVEEDT